MTGDAITSLYHAGGRGQPTPLPLLQAAPGPPRRWQNQRLVLEKNVQLLCPITLCQEQGWIIERSSATVTKTRVFFTPSSIATTDHVNCKVLSSPLRQALLTPSTLQSHVDFYGFSKGLRSLTTRTALAPSAPLLRPKPRLAILLAPSTLREKLTKLINTR